MARRRKRLTARSRYGVFNRSRELQRRYKAMPPPEHKAWVVEYWELHPGYFSEAPSPKNCAWQLVSRWTEHNDQTYCVTLKTATKIVTAYRRAQGCKVQCRNVATEQTVVLG